MAEAIVSDWLAEYEQLEDPYEIHTFASMHEHNQEIAEALYTIFNERLKYPDLVHSICNQFFSFYRSNEEQLKRFALQFVPVLIFIYLSSVVMGDKKKCRSVETLLICIYNVEVSTEDGYQKTVSFRMPVLAQASIYHEEKSLHATDLRRWEDHSNRDVKWGPLPQIESINAQNRLKVMSALLFAYNQQLSLIQKSALFHLCRIASQIVNQGFSKPTHAHRSSYGSDPTNSAIVPKPLPRIPLSSQFLVELVHSIYFAMFNDFGSIAIQTMDDIHQRACYEMFTDLILVTNAVKNSLHANPSGQPSDGPMGLSVALSPATNTVVVSKSMITNASFRTKKLPDDLDMEFLAKLPHQLSTTIERNEPPSEIIEEEQQQISNNSGSVGTPKDYKNKLDAMMKNPRRWKTWGWKYNPSGGSKTSSIEEEPDSPKKSLSSSKNSSPNASPKIKNKLITSPQAAITNSKILNDDSSCSTSTLIIPAAIRRKKHPINQSGTNKSDLRSSAGARLALEDNLDDSPDEYDTLLDNGRPASIHVFQTTSDDIPIQDEHSALMSITEETEREQQQIGARNTGIRSSKDGGGGIKAQAHKALIAGFKKSKSSTSSNNKSGSTDSGKEIIIIPPKPPIRKDKNFINRASIQLTGNMDLTDNSSTNNGPSGGIQINNNDSIQLQKLSNGIFNNDVVSDGKILDNNVDIKNSDIHDGITDNIPVNRSSVDVINTSEV